MLPVMYSRRVRNRSSIVRRTCGSAESALNLDAGDRDELLRTTRDPHILIASRPAELIALKAGRTDRRLPGRDRDNGTLLADYSGGELQYAGTPPRGRNDFGRS